MEIANPDELPQTFYAGTPLGAVTPWHEASVTIPAHLVGKTCYLKFEIDIDGDDLPGNPEMDDVDLMTARVDIDNMRFEK